MREHGASTVFSRAYVLIALLLAFTSCFTPPALRPARDVDLERALTSYPAGSAPVAIEVERDVTLRGVFVPSDANAPVVLHLLESSGSAASARGGYATLTQELSDLGFASLLVDYTGIGASTGSPTPDNLARDTRAMWDEAVRRAGGDPARVVVRATSIGTLAAATLLESGARPGAIVLVLPVMSDTVVRRFAREFRGVLVGWIAAALYTDVVDLRLDDVLRRARVPIVALSSPDEQFVDADERKRLRSAVEAAGGLWCERPGGHLVLTCDTRILFAEEIDLLRGLHTPPVAERARTITAALPAEVALQFAGGSPERARLEALCAYADGRQPLETAAVAVTCPDPRDGWRVLRLLPRIAKDKNFEELCAVCDLDDPAGTLPIDGLEVLCRKLDTLERFDLASFHPSPALLAYSAAREGHELCYSMTLSFTSAVSLTVEVNPRDVWRVLEPRGLAPADAERQLGRLLLKSFGYVDRLRPSDGGVTLEFEKRGEWRTFEAPPSSALGTAEFELGSFSISPSITGR
jgi:predicted alpha/beta hydrolase